MFSVCNKLSIVNSPLMDVQTKHFLLLYELAEDYLTRRSEFREEHLRHAWRAVERGDLVLAGALAAPADHAVLLFQGSSAEVAHTFAHEDPYVRNGLVKRSWVREWTTVVGQDAKTPLRLP